MNPDDFEALLRGADPAAEHVTSDTEDTPPGDHLLADSKRQWTELSARRVLIRRRLNLSLAAIGLFAILGGTAFWIADRSERNDAPIAATESDVPAGNGEAESDADAEISSEPKSHDRPSNLKPNSNAGPQQLAETDPIKAGPAGRNSIGESKRMPRHRTGPRVADRRNASARSPVTEPPSAETQLAEFSEFVLNAGRPGQESWFKSVAHLVQLQASDQRVAIELVSKIEDPDVRTRALDLICDAAGPTRRGLLGHWLDDPRIRPLAWERLVLDASLAEAIELVEHAETDSERIKLCEQIASLPEQQSVDLLVRLAGNAQWRSSVRASAPVLHDSHLRSLILLMRQRDRTIRTSAAFVLASVPGQHVDQVVCSMITRGHYRQPAYLVLLSRDTPLARAFLAQAASRPDLTPALVSARMHFANIQHQLHQWIAESKGAHDEPSDTTRRFTPDALGVELHACLAHVLERLG